MNIVIVAPKQTVNVQHIDLAGGNHLWFRSAMSGLCSLPIDLAIILPGCTDEQIAMATEKTRATLGKVVHLGRTISQGHSPV